MSIKIKFSLDNHKGLKEIQKFINKMNKAEEKEAKYGYFDSKLHKTDAEGSDPNMTEATLMYILHEGSAETNIPSRPVFRLTAQQMMDTGNSKKLQSPIENWLRTVIKAPNVEQALRDIGEIMKRETQSNFGRGNKVNLVDNSKRTQQEKGRNDPLVDTGTLRDSMKVKVE